MRSLKKLAFTAGLGVALSVAAVGPAAAQQTPTTGTVTTTAAGTTATTSTASGGSLTGIGGGTGSATALGNSSLTTPAINAMTGTGTTPTGISASNAFGGSYNNPYFQGTTTNLKGTPGGFGTALYGASGGGTATTNGTGNTINARSGNSAITTGGRTQGGGQQLGGQQAGGGNANQSGIVIALPRQISYTATLSFKSPVATVPQMATDLRATLDRSTMLANPRGVSLAMDGGVVVLSGRVATDDELRLVEGMVRLTPGVRDVRNELQVGPVTP